MPAGQAVRTGCLSAAPQRFCIGSNSFRALTCFEVLLRHHCSRSAEAESNRRGGKAIHIKKILRRIFGCGAKIASSCRGSPFYENFSCSVSFVSLPVCAADNSVGTATRSRRSSRQGRVSNYLFRGGATVHSKRRSASSLLPVSAVRKHIHGSRKTGSQVRDGALGNGDGAVS